MGKNKTATEVCRVMKSIFLQYGIPEKVKSDNGPPFNSGEYLQFANEWGFERKSFVSLQVKTLILWVLSGRVTHGKKDSYNGSSVSYVVNT